MKASRECPSCGAALAPEAPQGLCPRCLLAGALETVSGPTGTRVCQTPNPKVQTPDNPQVPGSQVQPTTPVPQTPNPVARFGDYELLEEIASGGMGVVWKARQVSLNRIVALKRILSGRFASEAEVKRFRTEAEAAAQLQHPNIVTVHEVGEREGHHFFSMEFVQGRDLAEIVFQSPLEPQRAARYVRDVAKAIQHAHERGVLHRDLKPSNVLIDADDRPRVTDFGIAKHLSGPPPISPDPNHPVSSIQYPASSPGLTLTGQVLGTPAYMPPEQAAGRIADVSRVSDVYSLGAILYELLTGRPPFRAATALETMRQVLEAEPASPNWVNPNVPTDLGTICLKCLEKDPPRRYGSARELAEDLERFLNHEPIRARPATRRVRLRKWAKRKPAHAALVGVSLVALGVLTGGLLRYGATLKEHGLALNDRLHHILVEQARAELLLGHRETALQRVTEAAALRRSPELRTEAIQALAQPGFRQVFEAGLGRLVVSRFSPDGRFLALGGETYVSPDWPGFASNAWQTLIRVYDVSSTNLLVELPWHLEGGPFDFSPDSRWLAVPTWGAQGGEVTLWEVQSGRATTRISALGLTRFSPDGTWLAIQESNRVSLHHRPGGSPGPGAAGKAGLLFDQPAAILAWTAPDELLLQCINTNENGRLVRWNLSSDRRSFPLNDGGFVRGRDDTIRPVGAGMKPGTVEAVAVSADGRVAAVRRVAGVKAEEELSLLDLDTGARRAGFRMPSRFPFPSPILLGREARKVVFPDDLEPGRLRVFDVIGERFVQGVGEPGTRLASPFEHFYHGPQYTSQGSSSSGTVQMRYASYPVLTTWRGVPRPSAPWAATTHGLHPDGALLAAGSGVGERELAVWDLESGRRVASMPGMSQPVWSLDGRWLCAKGRGMVPVQDTTGKVFMRTSGELARMLELLPGTPTHRLASPVRALQFSGDGTRLAVNLQSLGSQLWELTPKASGPSLRATTNHLRDEELFFRTDGDWVMNDRHYSYSGTLARVRRPNEKTVASLKGTGWVRGRDVFPDGRRLLLACNAAVWDTNAAVNGPHFQVWDLVEQRRLAVWAHPGRTGVYGSSDSEGPLAISPDGRRAATTCFSSSGIEIYDTQTGRRLHDLYRTMPFTLPSTSAPRLKLVAGLRQILGRDTARPPAAPEPFFREDHVRAILFTPDSRWVVSCAEDRAVIREVESGRELAQCRAGTNILALAISPDGRTLVTGDEQHRLRLWELPTGRELAHWPAHEAAVTALAFSPDGAALASGARDGTLRLWHLPWLRQELAKLGLDW